MTRVHHCLALGLGERGWKLAAGRGRAGSRMQACGRAEPSDWAVAAPCLRLGLGSAELGAGQS